MPPTKSIRFSFANVPSTSYISRIQLFSPGIHVIQSHKLMLVIIRTKKKGSFQAEAKNYMVTRLRRSWNEAYDIGY